jgi:hypothetical protein
LGLRLSMRREEFIEKDLLGNAAQKVDQIRWERAQ